MLRASNKSVAQIDNPLQEVADIRRQICAKAYKRNLWRGHDQQPAKQKQVHQINHHQREKCAVIAQIGLPLRNHPAGESEMERPGRADRGVKQSTVRLHVKEDAKSAVGADRENAVERKKIRRERDPEIGPVGRRCGRLRDRHEIG